MSIAERIAAAVPHDKALHFIGGAVLALVGLAAGNLVGWSPVACAVVLAWACAVIREGTNSSGWSWRDVAWTMAGCGQAVLTAWVGA